VVTGVQNLILTVFIENCLTIVRQDSNIFLPAWCIKEKKTLFIIAALVVHCAILTINPRIYIT
jgi:hypothetical protein